LIIKLFTMTKALKVKNTGLKIHYVPVADLQPADYNPRVWDEAAIKNLTDSISQYGLIDPIICNSLPARNNVVIGGHFRLKIAKDLGYDKVPVVYVKLSLEKEKELNLRLNRNTGAWDFQKLKEFNIEALLDIGFDDADLSNIWSDALETEDDNFDVQKELDKLKKPTTQPGDMFQLGSHRLICGDATKSEVVSRLVGNKAVNMIYCDPPFNISLDYNKGIGTNGKYGGIHTDDNRSDSEYRKFLKATMQNALAAASPDCHVFYYSDESYIGLVQSLFEELKLVNRRVCLWLKNNQNPTPQIAFNKVYEPIIYATRGKPYLNTDATKFNEVMNREVGSGNRMIEDILDLFNIWLVKRIAGTDYQHPTEKPPTLHEKALRRCTKPGDLVLDLFGGSGSTLIACEQLKRRCYIVELEPIFCDLIIKRYERLTNDKVKKLN
jgi:DNA modification methylase